MLFLNLSSILVHPFLLMFSSRCFVQNTLLVSLLLRSLLPTALSWVISVSQTSQCWGHPGLSTWSFFLHHLHLYLCSLTQSMALNAINMSKIFECFFSVDLSPKLGPHMQLPSRYFYLDNHHASKTLHGQSYCPHQPTKKNNKLKICLS